MMTLIPCLIYRRSFAANGGNLCLEAQTEQEPTQHQNDTDYLTRNRSQ